MQHQYWVTKKCVLRKLGSKEDECVVSSDAELDAKLELLRSVSDGCIHLQRVIDLYQERLCYLAQEENALGRYLKECGRNEKNSNAGQIMSTAGKALAYTGHQRLSISEPLVRLHHEVETFRGRAVTDTRSTVLEMEKARTEYRAALSWMKSASSQLDPDSGLGLERFRKAQSHVRSSKLRFDRLMLACLQKIDLLAAARCNMFSHALVTYQTAIDTFSNKAADILTSAALKLSNMDPSDPNVPELASSAEPVDKDQKLFFNAEYTDQAPTENDIKKLNPESSNSPKEPLLNVSNLLGEDFSTIEPELPTVNEKSIGAPNSDLLELSWPTNIDLLGGDFMPSRFIQEGTYNFIPPEACSASNNAKEPKSVIMKNSEKTESAVTWLSLFAELDPLSNQESTIQNSAGDRV